MKRLILILILFSQSNLLHAMDNEETTDDNTLLSLLKKTREETAAFDEFVKLLKENYKLKEDCRKLRENLFDCQVENYFKALGEKNVLEEERQRKSKACVDKIISVLNDNIEEDAKLRKENRELEEQKKELIEKIHQL